MFATAATTCGSSCCAYFFVPTFLLCLQLFATGMALLKKPRLKANFEIDCVKQQEVLEGWLKTCPKHDGKYNLPLLLQELEPVVLDMLLD